jgi:putative ABC transport system ATP-binding protein
MSMLSSNSSQSAEDIEKSPPLISLEDVSLAFDDGRIVALRNVHVSIARGEAVAVVGRSGSGKTTLFHVICGIRRPSSGVVRWNGMSVTTRRAWTALRNLSIGIVFQDFNLFPTLTASENVELALFGIVASESERRLRAAAALQTVGLSERATHLPHQLSGGERQRVAIARSIVKRPALILADEPTGNLDIRNSAAIMDLLFELRTAQGATLVMVTHARDQALRCGRQIEMKDGQIFESSPSVIDTISRERT